MYEGGWLVGSGEGNKGIFEGQGIFIDLAGVVREGHFSDGLLQGYGRIIYTYNANIYEGGLLNGKRQGFGKYKMLDMGYFFEGFFVDDVFEGQGLSQTRDGETYAGDWVGG